MIRGFWFWFLYILARIGLFFYHPILRVKGRENVPQGGRYIICANHSGYADPLWVVIAMGIRHIPRVMAKKEALEYPVIGWIMKKIGIIGVDREGTDVHAIKESIRALRSDQQLLIFPEGTRRKPGMKIEPKRGAVLLSARTDSPILPVWLSSDRKPFGPITCVIGKPYSLPCQGERSREQQLEQDTQALMKKIYEMGETQ